MRSGLLQRLILFPSISGTVRRRGRQTVAESTQEHYVSAHVWGWKQGGSLPPFGKFSLTAATKPRCP